MAKAYKDVRAYHRTHAQLAAGVKRTDARATAWSRRAADILLGATFAGLLILATRFGG